MVAAAEPRQPFSSQLRTWLAMADDLNSKSMEELLKMQSETVKRVLQINQAIARKSKAPSQPPRSLRSQTAPTEPKDAQREALS